ncbi:unnamed protein product, partial [Didymodactylos carnosus]
MALRGLGRGTPVVEEPLNEERQERPIPYVSPPSPTEHDDIFAISCGKGENIKKYTDIPVTCTPEGLITPINTFEKSYLNEQVLANIRECKYDDPLAIQCWSIPIILQHFDLLACAKTGSGKTAAFLLPIITRLLDSISIQTSNQSAPLVLIVSPTRELAIQTESEAHKFSFKTPIKTYQVKYFVLDEVDQMLNIQFEPDIRRLETLGLPSKGQRQTLMFSATISPEIQRIAEVFLQNYLFLRVGDAGGANEDIVQTIEQVPRDRKTDRLLEILQTDFKNKRCLVFVETTRQTDFIGIVLNQMNLPATTIHGLRTQVQRVQAFNDFKTGRIPILVATSVAARGLDFPEIECVINYDLPDTEEFYIHRIGRTARVGHLGKSISFFDPQRNHDQRIAPYLVDQLKALGQIVPEFLKNMTEPYVDQTNRTNCQQNVILGQMLFDIGEHSKDHDYFMNLLLDKDNNCILAQILELIGLNFYYNGDYEKSLIYYLYTADRYRDQYVDLYDSMMDIKRMIEENEEIPNDLNINVNIKFSTNCRSLIIKIKSSETTEKLKKLIEKLRSNVLVQYQHLFYYAIFNTFILDNNNFILNDYKIYDKSKIFLIHTTLCEYSIYIKRTKTNDVLEIPVRSSDTIDHNG